MKLYLEERKSNWLLSAIAAVLRFFFSRLYWIVLTPGFIAYSLLALCFCALFGRNSAGYFLVNFVRGMCEELESFERK
jgi:hypothetical protein